jgi:hypothetical protein
MKKDYLSLILIYFGFVLFKIVLSLLIPIPTIFSDEYTYTKLAQSFLQSGNFLIPGGVVSQVPLLYSIIISPALYFSNMSTSFLAIKVINSLVSSLIIFPLYFICRDFLAHKKTLMVTMILSLSSSILLVSNYIMAENLYYPLFLFLTYFIYKSFSSNNTIYFMLSGISLGLAYSTKVLGIIFVPITLILFLKFGGKLKNLLLHYIFAFIVVLPQLLKFGSKNGYSLLGLMGGYNGPTFVAASVSYRADSFVNWILIHTGYILLVSGIIFGLFFLCGWVVKEKKFQILYWTVGLICIITLLVVSNQANVDKLLYDNPFGDLFNSRPIGRYLDPASTLMMLTGFIVWMRYKIPDKIIKGSTIVSTGFVIAGTQLLFAPLFLFNNQNLTILGSLYSGLELIIYGHAFLGEVFHWVPYIVVSLLLLSLPYIFYKIRHKRTLVIWLIFLLILGNSVLSFGIHSWQSNGKWSQSSQSKVGSWINGNVADDSIVMLENIDCDIKDIAKNLDTITCSKRGTLLGWWINQALIFGDEGNLKNADYFITTKNQNLDLVFKDGDIKVYKI